MKKSSAKKKLFLLKILAVILCPITVFATTTFFVFIGCAELWKDIPTCGITSFIQWFTLISYRIIVYLLPAIILSFFRFDKRYKWMTRFIIFLNWTLFIYYLLSAYARNFQWLRFLPETGANTAFRLYKKAEFAPPFAVLVLKCPKNSLKL